MKKAVKYILVFVIGILVALLYFKNDVKKNEYEQVQVMLNEIENVSKLVVTETTVSEMYNYETADKYLFELLSFKKKVILLVNANVQVSYDLSQMEIETDSINKKVIIKSIPDETVLVSPDIQYYDLEQSSFNTFTKEELNKINEKSIDKIKETIDLSDIKSKAKEQLIAELKKLYNMTNILDWELVDETQGQLIKDNFKN